MPFFSAAGRGSVRDRAPRYGPVVCRDREAAGAAGAAGAPFSYYGGTFPDPAEGPVWSVCTRWGRGARGNN